MSPKKEVLLDIEAARLGYSGPDLDASTPEDNAAGPEDAPARRQSLFAKQDLSGLRLSKARMKILPRPGKNPGHFALYKIPAKCDNSVLVTLPPPNPKRTNKVMAKWFYIVGKRCVAKMNQ